MPTQFAELFNALAASFEGNDVKSRSQAGRQFGYITARTAMNRLDEVLGPEHWWDRYTVGASSVVCELTIRLPDGSTVTKCDAGGKAGMADEGDDDKSGFSDAFKRAAVKFGVGRYLYRDGVAKHAEPEPAAPRGEYAGAAEPSTVDGLKAWVDQLSRSLDYDMKDYLYKWATKRRYPAFAQWDNLHFQAAIAAIRSRVAKVEERAGAAT